MQKILIADDNISLLEILKLSFQELGYEVRSVSNKSDLFWALKVFTPDLIILDVFLDKFDGREICKKLRNEYHLNVPILLCSSNKYAIESYRSFGADDCLEKPYALPELITRVKQKLSKEEVAQ